MGFWNYKRVGGVRSSDPACFWLWVKGLGLKMEGCRFEAVYIQVSRLLLVVHCL